jgi:hypothetical protein
MKERKNGFFDRLDAVANPPAEPGITVREFAERYSITINAASARLQNLKSQGKLLEGRKRGDNGRIVKVYRFPEP